MGWAPRWNDPANYVPRMVDAYLECAVWTDETYLEDMARDMIEVGDADGPAYLDALERAHYTANFEREAREDVETFLAMGATPDDVMCWLKAGGWSPEHAGHDLWLTRNRHGAGFWDRGRGILGEQLTIWANDLGSASWDVDSDGAMYWSER